jgi:hypothetical protein
VFGTPVASSGCTCKDGRRRRTISIRVGERETEREGERECVCVCECVHLCSTPSTSRPSFLQGFSPCWTCLPGSGRWPCCCPHHHPHITLHTLHKSALLPPRILTLLDLPARIRPLARLLPAAAGGSSPEGAGDSASPPPLSPPPATAPPSSSAPSRSDSLTSGSVSVLAGSPSALPLRALWRNEEESGELSELPRCWFSARGVGGRECVRGGGGLGKEETGVKRC